MDECSFSSFGGNPYFRPQPGRQHYYSNYRCVQAGQFDDCIEIIETTPLEPKSESTKQYCPGVGLVTDGDLELVSIFVPRHK